MYTKSVSWKQQGSMRARDIGVGGGSVWIVGMDSYIYQFVNNRWISKKKGFKRITVDGSGTPYVTDRYNSIFKFNERYNTWDKLAGKATDIGVSSKGDLWIISTDVEGGGYGIYNQTGSVWRKVPGSALRIAVSPKGPWVVNNRGNIYRRVGETW